MRQLETTSRLRDVLHQSHRRSDASVLAASFPEDYADSSVEPAWIRRYCGEIDYAMATYDRLFDALLRFADNNTNTSWCLPAGSDKREVLQILRTELFIVSWSRFMAAMGTDSSAWSIVPAMIPMFNVIVSKERRSVPGRAAASLDRRRTAVYTEYENGLFALHLGQADLEDGCIVFRGRTIPSVNWATEHRNQ